LVGPRGADLIAFMLFIHDKY